MNFFIVTFQKANDTNKEDNEDSINLTIGEDEVKLFGEEVSLILALITYRLG